eukprot:3803882-Amphidinium_carterae.1
MVLAHLVWVGETSGRYSLLFSEPLLHPKRREPLWRRLLTMRPHVFEDLHAQPLHGIGTRLACKRPLRVLPRSFTAGTARMLAICVQGMLTKKDIAILVLSSRNPLADVIWSRSGSYRCYSTESYPVQLGRLWWKFGKRYSTNS